MKFPDPQIPRTIDDFRALKARLQTDREKSESHPPPFPHSLPIINQCTDPALPPPSRVEADSTALSPLELNHVAGTRQDSRINPVQDHGPFTVVVTSPIRVGLDKWSQVYKATLTTGVAYSQSVVVKIYQESKFDYPASTDFPHYGAHPATPYRLGWLFGTELAQRETWAYTTLRDLQGSVIPYFYGAFTFLLPHGEIAVGIILEELHGLDLRTYAYPLRDNEAGLMRLADSAMWALYAIQSRGVRQGDMSDNNVRVNIDGNDDSSVPTVTIFDFGFAKPIIQNGRLRTNVDANNMVQAILKAASLPSSALHSWRESRSRKPRPAWARMFLCKPIPAKQYRDFLHPTHRWYEEDEL